MAPELTGVTATPAGQERDVSRCQPTCRPGPAIALECVHDKVLHAAPLDIGLQKNTFVVAENTIVRARRTIGLVAALKPSLRHRHPTTLAQMKGHLDQP